MSKNTLEIKVPRALAPLLQPARYKGAWGGRGGGKSHFMAEQLIVRCFRKTTRAVCIREVQNSIKDSVKQLLQDKIAKLNLGYAFDVLESEIRGKNGSLIIFRGMQSYNSENIKSLENFDIAWTEEAQAMSQRSIDLLRPTIRAPGSELWFSWNPRYKTDPIEFLRHSPPEGAVVVRINWNDNPWFPAVLKAEKDHDFAADPDKAEHTWNGAYGSGQGAILSRWVNEAERAGRINDEVEYDDSGAPLELSSDIGFHDTATWWHWQRKVGGFSVFDYDHGHGMDADDWIDVLEPKLKGKRLGIIWLPHDARAKTFQSKHSTVERFVKKFGADKVGIVPQSKIPDRISAARFILPKCEFHRTRCEHGLDGLRAWEYKYIEDAQAFSREPVHNWASHPSDGYSYGCQIMQGLSIDPAAPPAPIPRNPHEMTYDQFLATAAPSRSGARV